MYCDKLFEKLEKKIDSGKTLDQIATEICPEAKNPRRKVINMIKVWQGGDNYQDYLTSHETLEYHRSKDTSKKSDKKSSQKASKGTVKKTPESKEPTKAKKQTEKVIKKKDEKPTPEDEFKQIAEDYIEDGGAGLEEYVKRFLVNPELYTELTELKSNHPDEWQTTIEKYFEKREFELELEQYSIEWFTKNHPELL